MAPIQFVLLLQEIKKNLKIACPERLLYIAEAFRSGLTVEEIKVLLPQLNIKASELVRTQEAIWKENYKGKILTDNEIINIMAKNPKLIERPIIEHNNKAVIGRPPENVLSLFT